MSRDFPVGFQRDVQKLPRNVPPYIIAFGSNRYPKNLLFLRPTYLYEPVLSAFYFVFLERNITS